MLKFTQVTHMCCAVPEKPGALTSCVNNNVVLITTPLCTLFTRSCFMKAISCKPNTL